MGGLKSSPIFYLLTKNKIFAIIYLTVKNKRKGEFLNGKYYGKGVY